MGHHDVFKLLLLFVYVIYPAWGGWRSDVPERACWNQMMSAWVYWVWLTSIPREGEPERRSIPSNVRTIECRYYSILAPCHLQLLVPIDLLGQITAPRLGFTQKFTGRYHLPPALRLLLDFLVRWFAHDPRWLALQAD